MPTTSQPRWDARRKRWYFNFAGRRYVRHQRADALALLAELIGEKPRQSEKPESVAELVVAYQQYRNDPWTKAMLRHWVSLFGTAPLASLDQKCLVILRDELVAIGQKPRTVRHKVGTAHRCLRWGKERGYLADVPPMPRTPKIHANPRDVPLPVLLDGLRRLRPNGRALATFILLTGCRPSEARLSRWEQFDLDNRRWHIPNSKTGAGRTVELTAEAVALLSTRIKSSERTGYTFTSQKDRPYTRTGFGSMLRRVGFSQYQLRHTFAQNAFDQGIDTSVVAHLLGHKGLDTVLTYMQVRRQRVRDAVQRLRSPLQRARDAQSEPTAEPPEPPTPRRETEPRSQRKTAKRRRAL